MAITPATEPTTATAEVIAGRLRISATRLARRLRQEAQTGLSPSQLSALTAVERHGPVTLGALADHEQVAPPTITRVVAKLEEADLVLRQRDPDDRRDHPRRHHHEGPQPPRRVAAPEDRVADHPPRRPRRRAAAPAWPTRSTSSTSSTEPR